MTMTAQEALQRLATIQADTGSKDLADVLAAFIRGDFNAIAGVTASAAEINKLDGSGAVVASGTQVANIAAVADDLAIDANGTAIAGAVNANAAAINDLIAAVEAFNIAADS
jgi:hypothetical protein